MSTHNIYFRGEIRKIFSLYLELWCPLSTILAVNDLFFYSFTYFIYFLFILFTYLVSALFFIIFISVIYLFICFVFLCKFP